MKKLFLHIKNGPLKDVKIQIKKELTIGRNSDNDVVIKELSVSRYHAKIISKNKIAIIEDCNSTHGVFVNDKKFDKTPICHGDTIKIGGVSMIVMAVDFNPGMTPKRKPEISMKNMDKNLNNTYAMTSDVYSTSLFSEIDTNSSKIDYLASHKRLTTIYKANEIISKEHNLEKLFDKIINLIEEVLPTDSIVIFLKELDSMILTPKAFKTKEKNKKFSVSSSIIEDSIEKKKAIISNSNNDENYSESQSIIFFRITSAICAPLLYNDEVLGVIYLDTRTQTKMFTKKDLELLVALAGPASTAIKNAQYVESLKQSNHETTMALASAIELRDHYTVGHTYRVTNFAVEIAKVLGWQNDKIEETRLGGVLHDIGKIAVDDAILRKPSKLTNDEFEQMKIHPARGAEMIENISFLKNIIPYCLYHHEKYDGTGYPYGLKGEEIPIEGRVISVADAFDAMTSNRPYRKGMPIEVAIAELEAGSGTQFDTECVNAMLEAFNNGKITDIMQNEKKHEMSIACPFCSTYIEIPTGLTTGETFLCRVCKRKVTLKEKNNAYYGEIIS